MLNSVYPFSASNITRHKETKKIAIISSDFIAFVKSTNKTAKSGGKNKYILLNPIYTVNITTYTNGVIDFLSEILRCILESVYI